MNEYHKKGRWYHAQGLFDKAILYYKKALTKGNNKHDLRYRPNKKLMNDMILALYHSNYYPVEKMQIPYTFDWEIAGKINCIDNCNCFVNSVNIKNWNCEYLNSYALILGFNNYDDIFELYDSFELQFRSEDMFMYRMWYESFSWFTPLNISIDGYDLFYCGISGINYKRGEPKNPHMDCYVYNKKESSVYFCVPYVNGIYIPGDESFFVYHNRYNDTWENHSHIKNKCLYWMNVL